MRSSPACLCWRYLHGFCWWYNSAYILHSSLPLLQAVFNATQDTLCQPKRVPNADKTKFRLFTNSQTGQKRKSDMSYRSNGVAKRLFFSAGHPPALTGLIYPVDTLNTGFIRWQLSKYINPGYPNTFLKWQSVDDLKAFSMFVYSWLCLSMKFR